MSEDRFNEIEEYLDMAEDMGMVSGDDQWMRQEIKRLRRIEDALRDDAPVGCKSAQDYVDYLMNVSRANPRPKDSDP